MITSASKKRRCGCSARIWANCGLFRAVWPLMICVSCFFLTCVLSKTERVVYLRPNWPVRPGVRTPGFHPGNRGSIPLRATKRQDPHPPRCGFFHAQTYRKPPPMRSAGDMNCRSSHISKMNINWKNKHFELKKDYLHNYYIKIS